MPQSSEISEFDDLGRLIVLGGEGCQSFVEREQVLAWLCDAYFRHRLSLNSSTVFDPLLAAVLLNQDPSHRLRRGRKKVATGVQSLRPLNVDQPNLSLVD